MTTATKYKTYSKYKSSGVDWLGDIPDGWKMKKLKHAVKELVGGGTPDTGNDQNWTNDENGTPWVNIADMTNAFYVQETEKRVTMLGLVEKNLRILPKKTLLYSMYASIGKVAILEIEAVTNQAILGVIEDKRKAVLGFIKWWLISIETHLSLFSTSSTQNNLNEFKVKNMPLFLPSLPQQKEIVIFLDRETTKIDEMIAKKQKMMELLKEKRQALITHAVTKGLDPKAKMKPSGIDWLGDIPAEWEVKRLKYMCSKSADYGLNIEAENYLSQGIRFIRTSDVNDSGDLSEEGVYLNPDLVPFEYLLSEGDILLSRSGTIGRSYVYGHLDEKGTYAGYLVRFRSQQNKLKIRFAYYFFHSQTFFDWIKTQLIETTIGNVNGQKYANIPIQLPNLKEQKSIADFLDRETAKIDEMMKKVEAQIEKLQEYRQALVTNAVTGKIMIN